MTKTIKTGLTFDNSFISQLKGFYLPSKGEQAPKPKLIKFNQTLAEELGLKHNMLNTDELALLLSGSIPASGSNPVSQVYAGHQFGGFTPQLGDGRALLLGEIINKNGLRRDIHLKGSGQTPYSRGGDGKAALGPVLREYIMGEAMYALKIPATRGLAVTITGEKINRQLVNKGAVLARVASSHIRVGTFQYFAARHQQDKVKLLADYTINRHFPELKENQNPYLSLLRAVRDRQADLIAQWVLVGFVHGVMNTDNMAISGETIDFGPCAFIDTYHSSACYSSIDKQKRYALGNQSYMAQWNIARLAETLLPLIDSDDDKAIEIATNEIHEFNSIYQTQWLKRLATKLGLSKVKTGDLEFADDLFKMLQAQHVDFTQFFRGLSDTTKGDIHALQKLFDNPQIFNQWHKKWLSRFLSDSLPSSKKIKSMNSVNPIYIPRNHLVEEALQAAEQNNDFSVFEKLLSVLANPYNEKSGLEKFAKPAPKEFGPYKTFCGT